MNRIALRSNAVQQVTPKISDGMQVVGNNTELHRLLC